MKEDCFAYKPIKKGKWYCHILRENICEKKECPFYKTAEDYVKGFEYYPEYEEICRKYGVEPKK
jgi:hypothetical protein